MNFPSASVFVASLNCSHCSSKEVDYRIHCGADSYILSVSSILESQNDRFVEIGRDLWRSLNPIICISFFRLFCHHQILYKTGVKDKNSQLLGNNEQYDDDFSLL